MKMNVNLVAGISIIYATEAYKTNQRASEKKKKK
jgi:hypothetical protein